MPASQERSRLDGVDVLRGLAILLVMVHHVCLRMPLQRSPLGQWLPHQLVFDLDWDGGNGVTVFFAVSGFLITLTSMRRWGLAEIRPLAFYRLRFARIAPLLLLLLAVLSGLHLAGVHGYRIDPKVTTLPRALFAALTFHLNWLEARHGYLPANWDVLWSLSVEETFYLFFPLLCRGLRAGWAWRVVLLGFVVAGPFARVAYAHAGIWSDTSYLGGMDAIALGCLAAMTVPHLQKMSGRGVVAMEAVGIAMMALILVWNNWAWEMGLYRTQLAGTVLPLGACLVMVGVAVRPGRGRWWSAPVRWFGRNSYEVYLTHMFVVLTGTAMFVTHGRPWRWAPAWLLGMVALAGVLGWVVSQGYTEPMNKWLRRGVAKGEVGVGEPEAAQSF